MGLSLKQRAEVSRLKLEIAQNANRVKVLNYVNENLASTRKRKLGWTAPGKPERDLTKSDRRRAMAMARQRVEENPIFQAIVNARIANIVGRELRLKMSSKDNAWDAQVEEWWKLEKDRLDVAGRRTWGQLLRMWQARRDIDGDVGIAMLDQQYENRPLSYVQTWEAEQICKTGKNLSEECGIDFDEYGMPIRYWVTPDPSDQKAEAKDFPASNFCLYMNDNTFRAHRARGVSLFLQSFAIGQDHADIMEGITALVKNASFIGLQFFRETDEDGNGFGKAGGTTTGENGLDYSSVKLLPGTILVNGENERAEVMEPKNPTTEVSNFEKKMVSRACLPFGLTYELLTGDYSQVNDRTMRVMLKQFEKYIRPEQCALGYVATKIFRWSLSRAVDAGILTPPANLKTWFDHRWGAPGFPYINILQEAQANIMLLDKGLTSRTKILAETGDDDTDDIFDELKYEQDSISNRELVFAAPNAAPVMPHERQEPDNPAINNE